MAKVLKQNGGEPYFETLVAADVPSNMPTGAVDQTLRNAGGTNWVSTGYLKVATTGAVTMLTDTTTVNPNLTLSCSDFNAYYLKCVSRISGDVFLSITRTGVIKSNSLSGSGTKTLVADATGNIVRSNLQLPQIPQQHYYVSGNYTDNILPYTQNLVTALASATFEVQADNTNKSLKPVATGTTDTLRWSIVGYINETRY